MNSVLAPDQQWEILAKEALFRPSNLARLCGVSVRTLQRHFKKNYGLTVSEWLRMTRMREAYQRLKNGQTVKEVAYSLGYKQLSHFSADFKKYFGAAPRFLASAQPASHSSRNGTQFNSVSGIISLAI